MIMGFEEISNWNGNGNTKDKGRINLNIPNQDRAIPWMDFPAEGVQN